MAADDRRDGGGNGEDHGDVRHQALSRRAAEQIANDGAADNHAGAGGEALQAAQQPEVLDASGKQTAQRGEREQPERKENDPAAAEGVRDGAVPERHHREHQQICRQRLLHVER